MMELPPAWTKDQLERGRRKAIALFREQRMREPLEKYLDAFDEQKCRVEKLLETLRDMVGFDSIHESTLVDLVRSPAHLDALRYLAGPPVSLDDLLVLADVERLSPKVLGERPEVARAVFQTVLQGLDGRRFPWVLGKREPTELEKHAAIVASAALMAAQRTATYRRHESKGQQEQAVFDALESIGFRRAPSRTIETFADAPDPGEFCPESMLGDRKADVVTRLHDKRVLAIECKVSNSFTNSIKRLNNDAAVKATDWIRSFGTKQIVPSAMLSGVFKLKNLVAAQERGLALWWAHDLKVFQRWVKKAR